MGAEVKCHLLCLTSFIDLKQFNNQADWIHNAIFYVVAEGRTTESLILAGCHQLINITLQNKLLAITSKLLMFSFHPLFLHTKREMKCYTCQIISFALVTITSSSR